MGRAGFNNERSLQTPFGLFLRGADALHLGYGFLSESGYLAEICEACRITFIGPGPEVMRLMGDKSRAKKTMMKAGVPVLPGSQGVLEDEGSAEKVAREVGFPVILKASAGGGGSLWTPLPTKAARSLPIYDSLIAQVMAHGRDRAEAIARMRRCLDVMVVDGIATNIPLHRRILEEPDFQAGRLDTTFMDRFQPAKS